LERVRHHDAGSTHSARSSASVHGRAIALLWAGVLVLAVALVTVAGTLIADGVANL
jgi:hypothetical protein